METGVVTYNITDAAIAEMESIYMELTITDLDDKEQFDAVHSARMTVKGKRVEVEKRRKELKADALEYGRKVDTEAKRIFGKLEPIESHLDREEKKVTDEQKRIKEEADRQERAKIEARMLALQKVNCNLPFFDVAGMTDDEYEDRLRKAADAYLAEQKRLADEEAARKAELERLAVMNAEMERKKEELDKKEAEAKAESDRITSEKAQWEAGKRAEQERKDREAFEVKAKEAARVDAEFKAAAEAARIKAELEKKVAKEAAEKARAKELQPDRDKLFEFADKLIKAKNDLVPEFKYQSPAYSILSECEMKIDSAIKKLIAQTEELK